MSTRPGKARTYQRAWTPIRQVSVTCRKYQDRALVRSSNIGVYIGRGPARLFLHFEDMKRRCLEHSDATAAAAETASPLSYTGDSLQMNSAAPWQSRDQSRGADARQGCHKAKHLPRHVHPLSHGRIAASARHVSARRRANNTTAGVYFLRAAQLRKRPCSFAIQRLLELRVQTLRTTLLFPGSDVKYHIVRDGCRRYGRNVACDWSVGGAYYGDTDSLCCDFCTICIRYWLYLTETSRPNNTA